MNFEEGDRQQKERTAIFFDRANVLQRQKKLIDKFHIEPNSIGLKSRKDYADKYYKKDEVIRILDNLGYNSRYFRSEDFFAVKQKYDMYNLEFHCHFSLAFCMVEVIMGVEEYGRKEKRRGKVFIAGSTLPARYKQSLVKETGLECPEGPFMPIFSNYDELEEILKESLAIYEDFKKEVLKVYEGKSRTKDE